MFTQVIEQSLKVTRWLTGNQWITETNWQFRTNSVQFSRDNVNRSLNLKTKFHYAILVADRFEGRRRPVADLLTRASLPLTS